MIAQQRPRGLDEPPRDAVAADVSHGDGLEGLALPLGAHGCSHPAMNTRITIMTAMPIWMMWSSRTSALNWSSVMTAEPSKNRPLIFREPLVNAKWEISPAATIWARMRFVNTSTAPGPVELRFQYSSVQNGASQQWLGKLLARGITMRTAWFIVSPCIAALLRP